MESGWVNVGGGDGCDRGQNSNLTNTLTPYDWAASVPGASVLHALLLGHVTNTHEHVPDMHMMCLKLGKRSHYCENSVVVPDRHVTAKRGRPTCPYHVPTTRVTSATRCQVEGCNVGLGNVKDYYRRHKVCEVHSKAPNVVVFGLQQRFCQQCSRFHEVTEFDEAKRSCRRRLEGHNLRRRKGTLSNSLPRNFPHSHEDNSMMIRRLGPLTTLPPSPSPSPSQSKPVCVLSLLSSPKTKPWISSGDLSSRGSAALYELIAANRANFSSPNGSHQPVSDDTMHTSHDSQMWYQFDHATMTLDLKQAPGLDFGLLSMKEKSKDPEEWTDHSWSNFGGANVA